MSNYENWESVKAEFERSNDHRRRPMNNDYDRIFLEWLMAKHHPPMEKSPEISLDGLVIDKPFMMIRFPDGREISAPRKIFDLLAYLASNNKRVLSRDEIMRVVWGTDVCVVDRTIDVHVKKIRGILGQNSVTTYKGVGYAFNREGCDFRHASDKIHHENTSRMKKKDRFMEEGGKNA